MAELIHFSPQSHLTAAENLAEFIRMCKDDLTLLGRDLKWNSWQWTGVQFTKLGTLARGCKDEDALDPALMDFAKAYFRYQQSHKPTQSLNETKALRTIEAALLERNNGDAAISGLDMATLDQAALLGRNHYSPAAAYHCGRELARLAAFVTTKRLIDSDLGTWKHPIKKPTDATIQTGPKARAIRDKKLPDQDALDALAEIFSNNPQNPKDMFTTSTFAMTMCAPSRITEILHLPVDCEVEERDSKGILRYGWRFFSGKGYGGNIKWIPTVMVPIAKEAMRRIRSMTEEGRKLARWMEENPNQVYRHAHCPDVPDNQPLTVFQACEFLGLSNKTRSACTSSLHAAKLVATDGTHTLRSLWEHKKSRQPKGLPWLSKEKGIKYSNALFCMTLNTLHRNVEQNPIVLWAPTGTVFNSTMSPRESLECDYHQSIFERYGYKSMDGQPLQLASHQARHLLHTIAKRGGLSEDKAAKWAGRADMKQNSVYNHMSEFEMVAKAEALDTSLTLFGPAGEVAQFIPISTQEFNLMERGAVHITEFGVCVHDYTMSPCEKFRDCLNCQEQVCLKGDGERLKRIKARLEEVEKDYAAAKEAIEQGYSGADRWYEIQEKTVVRVRQLVQILESPEVPDGSQIKLRDGKDFSHLRRAIREKADQALVGQTSDAGLLSEMTRQLGADLG